MSSSIARVIEEAIGVQAQTDESAQVPSVAEAETPTPTVEGEALESAMNGTPVAEAVAAPAVSESTVPDVRTIKGILEAMLFVATDPIPMARVVSLLGGASKQEVEQALAALQYDYEQEGRGLQLAEIAGGYKIVTKAEFAPWLKRMDKTKAPAKLSRSALESLAIIAYKQPIVRGEIEQIRGVETSGVLRTLLERKLVRIVGRKEEPGRPIMYGTTKFFLEHFGLRDLSQLPPLREFKELGESEQAMLPIEETVAVEGASPETASTELPAPESEVAVLPTEMSGVSEPEPAEVPEESTELMTQAVVESIVSEESDLVVAEVAEEA